MLHKISKPLQSFEKVVFARNHLMFKNLEASKMSPDDKWSSEFGETGKHLQNALFGPLNVTVKNGLLVDNQTNFQIEIIEMVSINTLQPGFVDRLFAKIACSERHSNWA